MLEMNCGCGSHELGLTSTGTGPILLPYFYHNYKEDMAEWVHECNPSAQDAYRLHYAQP